MFHVSTMLNILMQNLINNYSDNSLLQVWGNVQILYNMQNSKQDGGKRKPLTECTVVELKAKARTRNIKGFSCMRKAELVSALRRK